MDGSRKIMRLYTVRGSVFYSGGFRYYSVGRSSKIERKKSEFGSIGMCFSR